MKWCADYIRSKGFRAGIWCIPFSQSSTEMFQNNPHLFVRREDGTSPGERHMPIESEIFKGEDRMTEWAGRYFIDPTGEEGLSYLRKLFEMLCGEWGYDYVKIDAQGMMASLYERYRRMLYDPSLAGDRVYRLGLQTIREAMGEERFLLNCGEGWASCGICDGYA